MIQVLQQFFNGLAIPLGFTHNLSCISKTPSLHCKSHMILTLSLLVLLTQPVRPYVDAFFCVNELEQVQRPQFSSKTYCHMLLIYRKLTPIKSSAVRTPEAEEHIQGPMSQTLHSPMNFEGDLSSCISCLCSATLLVVAYPSRHNCYGCVRVKTILLLQPSYRSAND